MNYILIFSVCVLLLKNISLSTAQYEHDACNPYVDPSSDCGPYCEFLNYPQPCCSQDDGDAGDFEFYCWCCANSCDDEVNACYNSTPNRKNNTMTPSSNHTFVGTTRKPAGSKDFDSHKTKVSSSG